MISRASNALALSKQCLLIARRTLAAPASSIKTDAVTDGVPHRFGRKILQLAPTPTASDCIPISVRTLPRWTASEKQHLLSLISEQRTRLGGIDWVGISQQMPGGKRTHKQCRSMYKNILKQMRTAAVTKTPAKSLIEESLVSRYKRWTPEEDRSLIALRSVGNMSWKETAKAIKAASVIQCKNRYRYLRTRRGPSQPPLRKDLRRKSDPKTPAYKYKPVKQGKAEPWTKNDDERLRRLLVESRTFDFWQLHTQFPNKNYGAMYLSLYKLCTQPVFFGGMWSSDEHRALLRLVGQHGSDWQAIAEAMPTGRTHIQCRTHYIAYCVKPGVRRGQWSEDETAQLLHLVDLERQRRLSERSSVEWPLSHQGLRAPGRFLDALQKDESGSAAAAAVNGTPPVEINWALVASRIMTRTANQCRTKFQSMRSSHESRLCSEVWTREEDLALYKLHKESPNRWTWIAANLPRPRRRESVARRYTQYLGIYVDMLRKCRPHFDPLDDNMHEVHMRCEVLAWYRGQMEGYRDPAKRPDDMDLTGLRALRAAREGKGEN
ncbi:hypothetical protein EC988_004032 [Linderina pennispora]|nr:hypothetical protein EC988_004032 [Linderina pennispora]